MDERHEATQSLSMFVGKEVPNGWNEREYFTARETVATIQQLVPYGLNNYYLNTRAEARNPYENELGTYRVFFDLLANFLTENGLVPHHNISELKPTEDKLFTYNDACRKLIRFSKEACKKGKVAGFEGDADKEVIRNNFIQRFESQFKIVSEKIKEANPTRTSPEKIANAYLEAMLNRIARFSNLCERAASSRARIVDSDERIPATILHDVESDQELKTRIYEAKNEAGAITNIVFNLAGSRKLFDETQLVDFVREKFGLQLLKPLDVYNPKSDTEFLIQPAHINPVTAYAFARSSGQPTIIVFDSFLFKDVVSIAESKNMMFTNCGSPHTSFAFHFHELVASVEKHLSENPAGHIQVAKHHISIQEQERGADKIDYWQSVARNANPEPCQRLQ